MFEGPETGTGTELSIGVPPSSSTFWPQQVAVPVARSAQVWEAPAVIAVAPESPETSVGARRSVVVPSPSWPEKLEPQHLTVPPVRSAHVWSSPALSPDASAMTPERPVTATGVSRVVVVPSPS